MNSDVEEIKSRLNIVDVLREYIRVDKAGINYKALCPFHNEKTPSFMINEEKQIWHCFGCGKGGDVFKFIMEIEGLDFKEVLKMLAEKAGVELKKGNPRLAAEKTRILEMLELSAKFYEYYLWQDHGRKSLDYLRERGLRDDMIRLFRLGYAPNGWRNMMQFLMKKGFGLSEILKTGLLVQNQEKNYDRFRDRIMFPITDVNGKVIGFSARVAPGGDESQAKYINTPETEVYHKSKVLYGIGHAKNEMRKKDFVFLVEGNLDVIASYQSGIQNTVAVSGTALTPEQIDLIRRYTDKIKMCFDMDNAGQQATKKSIKLCFEKDMAVQVVALPEGKDAADLARKNPGQLLNAVESSESAMEYFFQKAFSKYDKTKPEQKRLIAEELLDAISDIENAIEKMHWVKILGEELGIEEGILTDMLKKIRLKERISGLQQGQKIEIYAPKKIDLLIQGLLGLMLAYPEVWKKIVAEEKGDLRFLKDGLLNFVIEKSGELNFNFDNLLNALDDREMVSRAEKIFFETRFRLDLNNQPEEVIINDPLNEGDVIFTQIKKEIKKEELEKITRELKKAEEENNKQAIALLREQFNQIYKDLQAK